MHLNTDDEMNLALNDQSVVNWWKQGSSLQKVCRKSNVDICKSASFVFSQYETHFFLFLCLSGAELHLMFSLMDKVPSGIEPMLKDLEEHIINAGLADMVAAAETITTVGAQAHSLTISQLVSLMSCSVLTCGYDELFMYLFCKQKFKEPFMVLQCEEFTLCHCGINNMFRPDYMLHGQHHYHHQWLKYDLKIITNACRTCIVYL